MESIKPGSRNDLHITIVTSPSGGTSLAHDLNLVKAAILYADHATIYSATTSMILTMLTVGLQSPEQRADFVAQMLDVVATDEAQKKALRVLLHNYQVFRKKKRLRPDQVRVVEETGKLLDNAWTEMAKKIEDIAINAGAEGIIKAVQSGRVDIGYIDVSQSDLAGDFTRVIGQAITDTKTYPLFDEFISDLASAGIREGLIEVSKAAASRSRHVGLAANLFDRIPLFDAATVDEVLDIRRELDKPLVRFRSGLVKFSGSIESTPWDKDFLVEAQSLFLSEVQPALTEIEEQIQANSYLTELLTKLASEPLVIPTGSALALLISQLSNLPTAVSQAIGVGLSGVKIAYDAYDAWKEEQKKIEQNCLFFYYKTRKHLS